MAAKERVQAVDSLRGAILEQSAVPGKRESNAVVSGHSDTSRTLHSAATT